MHYIDRITKKAKGNSNRGQSYYQTVYVGCHGLGGKGEETPSLGKVANDNPWEVLHKIDNGQPGVEMPALRALDILYCCSSCSRGAGCLCVLLRYTSSQKKSENIL